MEFYSYKNEDCSSHFDIGYLWSSARGKNKSISSIRTYRKTTKTLLQVSSVAPQNKENILEKEKKQHSILLLGTGVGICTNLSQHKNFSLVWQLLQWNHYPKIKSEILFTCCSKIISVRNFKNKLKIMNTHK